MGLPHAQVKGTYGERCTSGSNLNTYADWNANQVGNKDQFGDHNTAAHDPTKFPADPISDEEKAMLAATLDLTASCSSTCYWCIGTTGRMTARSCKRSTRTTPGPTISFRAPFLVHTH